MCHQDKVSGFVSSTEEEEKKQQIPLLMNITMSTLNKNFGKQNVVSNKIENEYKYDFIVNIDDKKIPIEVKYGHVIYRDIADFLVKKNKMTKDEGIIITNSLPTKKADNFARKNKILIIDKITNETNLIEKLKYIFRKNGE